MKPGFYRIIKGSDAGAVVRLCFMNNRGLADCRYAEDHGAMKKGEIIVVRPENLKLIEDNRDAEEG